jgi:hypothetical protein
MYKLLLTAVCVTALSILTACDDRSFTEKVQDQRMADGKAALAQCIEVKCEVLDLHGLLLEDYSALNTLTHVTSLMVSLTSFSNLSDIADMTQLTELHMTHTDVSDLTGLGRFSNLRLLHASGLPVGADNTPISRLTGLTELALGGLNLPSEAAFIATMPHLENLIVSWRDEGDSIEFLRNHPSLKNIELGGQLPQDQTPLLALPQLEAILVGSPGAPSRLNEDVGAQLKALGILTEIPPVLVC